MISFCSSIGTGFVNQLGIPVLHLKDMQCHLQAQMEKWIYGETSPLWEDGERVGLGLNGRVEISPLALNLEHLDQNLHLQLQV